MICRQCAFAADYETFIRETYGPDTPLDGPVHCTDPACACQHKPITPKEKS